MSTSKELMHTGPALSSRLLAFAAPLGAVGGAWLLWRISDALGYIGPFDKATFGWLVVVPVWSLTPLIAAFTWRRLDSTSSRAIAAASGALIATAAALAFWSSVAFPDASLERRAPLPNGSVHLSSLGQWLVEDSLPTVSSPPRYCGALPGGEPPSLARRWRCFSCSSRFS
jgi:hypothetical protein